MVAVVLIRVKRRVIRFKYIIIIYGRGMSVAGIHPDDLKFKREIRALIAGPSGSGKTSCVLKLLRFRESLFTGESFQQIFWCVSDPSSIPSDLQTILPTVKIIRGLSFVKSIPKNSLIVFDDVISKIYESEDVLDLAVRRSSHEQISFIILSQNLYYQSKYSRTINLSMSYLILFNFLRDNATYETLCRQINCRGYRPLHTALTSHLNEAAYNFFIIDVHPRTAPLLRYRTLTFLDEEEARENNCGDPILHTLFLTAESVDCLCNNTPSPSISNEQTSGK